ncbi:MAG: diguanylate cyclase [Pseudomonadota bacterium]
MRVPFYSIRTQLLILAVVATGSIWAGAFLQYRNLVDQGARLAQIRDGLAESREYAGLATDAARERGLTNGWMQAAPGLRNDAALQAARQLLDASIARLGPVSGRLLDPSVASRLVDLNRYRTIAADKGGSATLVFAWYSSLVATIHDSAATRLASGMVEVGLPYEHVTHLSQAVEHLSQLRGIVNGALMASAITASTPTELTRQLTLHHEYMRLYERAAPKAALTRHAATIHSRPVRSSLDLAQRLVDQQSPQRLGLEPGEWWALSTAGIDRLQQVADLETARLTEQATLRMHGLERQMKLFVAALVALGLVTLGLTLATVTRIVRGLNALLRGLDGVATGGNFETRIALSRPDEFNTISGGVNKLLAIAATVVAERERESLTDALTGLLNRRGMNAQLQARLHPSRQQLQPNCLLVLDVDHFKRINDRFGHPEGDRVLVQLAGLLTAQLRADDVVCRYGGEEFLALLTGCGPELATTVANKLRLQVEQHDFGLGAPVTVSIGVAEWHAGVAVSALIAAADAALYAAKSGGRNCVMCAPPFSE